MVERVPLPWAYEDAVDPIKIDHKPCPRCGGKMQFKATVENPTTGSPVHFFRCEDCGHVDCVSELSS
jgi:predicted  nucleic acid-binding Zn ribbon protein